jgi:excisionase family DNA binding protein
MNDTDRLVPIGEAARLLGVSVPTLRGWDRSGSLPALRLPESNRRAYRESELRCFLEALRHAYREDTPTSDRRSRSR